MTARFDNSEDLSKTLITGLQSHDLSAATGEIQSLRQSQPSADFQATLFDANSALHKAGLLPGFDIVGVDRDELLVKGPNNNMMDLDHTGQVVSLALQKRAFSPNPDASIPSQFSYDPSTNTESYNLNLSANQTQAGIDATMSRGTGVAAEVQTQIGKVNVMYEHNLGDKGQDVWVSTGVGNGGSNILEANIGNQNKPGVVYMASIDQNQMSTISLGAGLDGSASLTFRRRM